MEHTQRCTPYFFLFRSRLRAGCVGVSSGTLIVVDAQFCALMLGDSLNSGVPLRPTTTLVHYTK